MRPMSEDPGTATDDGGRPQEEDTFAETARDFVVFWENDFESETPSPSDPPFPFEGSMASRVDASSASVRDRCPREWDRLTEVARRGLRRGLLRTLCGLAAQPLQLQRSSALSEVLDRYPRLGPLLETATSSWVESTCELLRRLDRDSERLEAAFGNGAALGSVTSIETDLSDRHDGGRTVMRLTFSAGPTLIYKPRDTGMEMEYNRLIDWINARGIVPSLRTLTVIDGNGTCGWIENAQARPCENASEVRLYYRRAGMLMALWWVLDATDIQMSNIAACGPHPVLLDAETFFQTHTIDRAETETDRERRRSIDRLSFLPRRETGGQCEFDVTGLGGIRRQRTDRRVPLWDHVGTARMRLHYESAYLRVADNAVRLGGEVQTAARHASSLESGFREMHRFLAENSDELLAPDGPVIRMGRQTRRILVRRTRDYYEALNHSLRIESLRTDPGFKTWLEPLPHTQARLGPSSDWTSPDSAPARLPPVPMSPPMRSEADSKV